MAKSSGLRPPGRGSGGRCAVHGVRVGGSAVALHAAPRLQGRSSVYSSRRQLNEFAVLRLDGSSSDAPQRPEAVAVTDGLERVVLQITRAKEQLWRLGTAPTYKRVRGSGAPASHSIASLQIRSK